MEIVSKVCMGILGVVGLCLIAGFIDLWWEERRKRKDQERYERFMQKLSENRH